MSKSKILLHNKFSTKAHRRGLSPEEFASQVKLNPGEYSEGIRNHANLASMDLPEYDMGGSIFGGAAAGAGAGAAGSAFTFVLSVRIYLEIIVLVSSAKALR